MEANKYQDDLEYLTNTLEFYMGKDFEEDSNLSRSVKQALKNFEEAIGDLELYKKVFDITLEHNRQENTICLFSGCPRNKVDIDGMCYGDCPTKEELKKFLLDEAKKELDNGKRN